MSGGLTATGLLVLLLGLIGGGVGLYYAYICLQARPLRPKKPKDAEHGPLIPPDPDVNGNHEDVPLDPSAPLHDEADAALKLHPDLPDEGASPPLPPGADSPKPPKDKEDILISVEDDVPPAKVVHETETAPVASSAAPLGFVVPPHAAAAATAAAAAPQETPMDHHPIPRNVQPQPEKVESPPSCSSAPVPIYIPSPPQKKTNAISDEEDGLLLHKPAPQDDSLSPDLCATLPVSHPPRKPCPREEPAVTSQPSPPASPPKPEEVAPAIPPRQPATVPKVDNIPKPEAHQPLVVVVPQTTPSCPEKEELKPVGKAVDTLPPEDCDQPAPVCVKDNEHPPSATTNTDTNKETPIPTLEEVPMIKVVPPISLSVELGDPLDKGTTVDSDDSLSAGTPAESVEPTPESVENNEATKNLPENEKTEAAPEKADTHEEARSVSSCSVSSEDPALPSCTPVSGEGKFESDAEPVAPLESSHQQPRDEEVVTGNIPVSPAAAPKPASDIPPTKTAEETLGSPEKEVPSMPLHSPADEAEVISDASSDVSDAHDEGQNIPTVMPDTPSKAETETDSGKETLVIPPQPAADIPIDVSSIPMEAYSVMPDDTSDEESSPLPVIKEEGSLENNSEGSIDTDSSEPEVTEYSFSSGPSAPSTTGVLANEVSCTLEPKVTKFTPITDLDDSESEGSDISDDDLEDDDMASLPKHSDDELHDNTDSAQNKATDDEKPANTTSEKNNAVSDHYDTTKKDSLPDVEPAISCNGPVGSQTPNTASKPPLNEMSDSGDSDTESEGAEAEVELKEEVVTVPAVVRENINNHAASPPDSPSSPSTNHTDKPAESCPPKVQTLKTPQGNSNSLEEIPGATDKDDDGLSLSPSESCDLSDAEVMASTPKKSMIPKLVKHSEA